jgi:hypothetical protein
MKTYNLVAEVQRSLIAPISHLSRSEESIHGGMVAQVTPLCPHEGLLDHRTMSSSIQILTSSFPATEVGVVDLHGAVE